MSRARAAAGLALALLAGCATGGKLAKTAESVKVDVEKARKSGAAKCAPKELAAAEANLDFGLSEMEHGDPSAASSHLRSAERSVKKALELSKTCAPAQVTIKQPKEQPRSAVVIEKVDTDRDGVADLEDRCPEVPGLPALLGCPDADGDGIPDGEDACPAQAGGRDTQGCPASKDSDTDGLPDDIDRCPLDPEDQDGFQDEDGCPDPDNDGDGIVDKVDACPASPGPFENRGCPVLDQDGDGVPDAEDRCPAQAGPKESGGCPKKYTLVEVKKDVIAIKQQVHFASAKWKVLPDSYPLLDQVAQVLKDYPAMKVSIEGHTDTVGATAMNMKLSQARAEAVRDYLVGKGVSADRLQAIGHGPTRPIASNKTEPGRAKNRRTEFRITALE